VPPVAVPSSTSLSGGVVLDLSRCPKAASLLYRYVDRCILQECVTQHTLQHIYAQVVRASRLTNVWCSACGAASSEGRGSPHVQRENFVLREAQRCPRHGPV
jgi:hypothetical protein